MSHDFKQSASNGIGVRKTKTRTPSQDLVDIIWRLRKIKKLTLRKIAAETGKSAMTICKILRRCDPVTGIHTGVPRGRPRKSTAENDEIIRDIALANPYVGLEGLTALYNKTAEPKLAYETIRCRLDRLGLRTVDVPADAEEVRDKKRFPKSQFVRKFEEIPQKAEKQRIRRRNLIDSEDPESAGLPVKPKKRRSKAKIKMPISLEFDRNLMPSGKVVPPEAEEITASRGRKKRSAKTEEWDTDVAQTLQSADLVPDPRCPAIPVQAPPVQVESMDITSAFVTKTASLHTDTTRKKSSPVIFQDAVDIIFRLRMINNFSLQQIGERTGKSRSLIWNILRRCDPVTGIHNLTQRGRPRKSTAENDEIIRDIALANPYVGLEGLTALYNKTAEPKLAYETIRCRLYRLGLRTVDVPADVEEVRGKKRFPKSQFVRKFEQVPVKSEKKRTRRRNMIDTEDPESAGLPVEPKKRRVRAKIKIPMRSNEFDDGPILLPRVRVASPVEEKVRAIMALPVGHHPLPLLPES